MIKLDSIELREIHLALREPFRISSGEITQRRILLLRLQDTDGLATWSECVAGERPNYSPETIDTAWLAITQWLAPLVLGHGFGKPTEVLDILSQGIKGHNMAKAAVEMGLWSLFSLQQGLSLKQLVGGTRDKVATGISLGIQASPGDLAKKVTEAISAGYARIKIKIGPGRDLDYVAAARDAAGAETPLMADANSAYSLADLETLKRLDRYRLMMIEQPLAWDDIFRHATLQSSLETPICLDESITDLSRAEEMVAQKSGRIINIKPGRVGGFGMALRIHDYCLAQKVPVWCGGMLETGIGRAYNVALASLPGFTLPGDLSPSRRYWDRDIVSPEWTMDRDGMVKVPDGEPGLGVTVDGARIDDLTVRRETLSVA